MVVDVISGLGELPGGCVLVCFCTIVGNFGMASFEMVRTVWRPHKTREFTSCGSIHIDQSQCCTYGWFSFGQMSSSGRDTGLNSPWANVAPSWIHHLTAYRDRLRVLLPRNGELVSTAFVSSPPELQAGLKGLLARNQNRDTRKTSGRS